MGAETLSSDDLQAGNGLMMASSQGANLIGSAVAGVVVAALTTATALAGVLSNQLGPAIFFPFSGLLLLLAMLFGMTQRALREI